MKARILRVTPRNLQLIAGVLRRGDIAGLPTETVYGLAANALDPAACRKIYRAKGRPSRDPLIVHVPTLAALEEVAWTNPSVERLARHFWPGPLTVVLKRKPAIPDIVSAGLPSVAVRIPAHPVFQKVLELAGVPLAAPSANRFGYISPTTAEHVRQGLGAKVGHILDGGPAAVGIESTIVDLRDESRPRLLRPGAVTRARLERILGRRVDGPPPQASKGGMIAPGLLKRHYSPRTPVVLHARLPPARPGGRDPDEAWIQVAGKVSRAGNEFVLDPKGNASRAARNLFAVLRRADAGGFRRIHVELVPGSGVADAINDRLRRAAAR